MDKQLQQKLYVYQITIIFSIVFALVGFSYNVWRMEVSEQNNNIRTACFEMLLELSSLEQLVYTAHYDKDEKEASPRKGWVKIGFIDDLSVLTTAAVEKQADDLKVVWQNNWATMAQDRQSTDRIVIAIDAVRSEIKQVMRTLN